MPSHSTSGGWQEQPGRICGINLQLYRVSYGRLFSTPGAQNAGTAGAAWRQRGLRAFPAGNPVGAGRRRFFYYRPYCCRTGKVEEAVLSNPGRLRIVEGVYSLHPTLRDAYDLKVFLSVDPVEQSSRILQRSGPALHRRFMEEWIPLEEWYFSGCDVRRQCQLIIENS